MAVIVTRELGATGKGLPLSNDEMDNNFINLNDDKVETQVLVDTKQPCGFVDRTATLTFDNGTRLFSITGTYSYYLAGVKYTDSDQSFVLSTTVGQRFIYFNENNELIASGVPWNFEMVIAPIAIIYWDGSVGRVYDERHAAGRNTLWHSWAHRTIGTRYISGLGGTFATGPTSMSIAPGIIMDEDIIIDIPSTTSSVLVYRNGVSDVTLEDSTVNYYKEASAGSNLQYDNGGTLTNASNNYYVNQYVYATNDINDPIYVVIGQAQHQRLDDAEAETSAVLSIPIIPSPEFKPIYKVIMRNTGNTPTYVSTQDLRLTTPVPGTGGTINDHNSLAGLQGGTAGEHYHLTQAQYDYLITLVP